MADVYKGLTIKFGADTVGLDKALRDINKQSRSISSELKKVDNALKFNPGNTDLLRQKQVLLAKQVETTRTRLEALKQAQAKLGEGDIDSDQYRNLQREIIETGSKLENLQGKARDTDKALRIDPKAAASLKKVEDAAKTAGKALLIAGAAAGAALTGIAVKAVTNADELQRQADVTGLSAERLQELQFAGANLGVELDTIAGAQAKLTKSMASAAGGSGKQADAFKALGVSVLDSNGNLRDTESVMGEAFSALNGVGNETERNALAMQIFGKSAMDLNPMITAGADGLATLSKEARDSGAVMSNEAVAGLDTFGDTLDNLKSSVIGTLGEELGPVLQDLAGWLKTDLLPAFKDMIGFVSANSGWLVPFVAGIAAVAATVAIIVGAYRAWVAIQLAWTAVTTAATVAQTALNVAMSLNPIGIIILAIIALVAGIVLLWKKNEKFREFMTTAWEAIKIVVLRVVNWFKTAPAAAFQAVKDKAVAIFTAVVAFLKKWGPWMLAAMGGPLALLALLVVKNWDKIKAAIVDKLTAAKDFVKETLAKIKRFFTDLVLKLPHIKLPHFKLTGEFSLKNKTVPKLGVEWYASGGSFGPGAMSLIGVGDQTSGYEHVLRDDQIVALMKRALDTGGGPRQIVLQFNQPVRSYSETRRAVRDVAEEMGW